jgi:hypothetical protein
MRDIFVPTTALAGPVSVSDLPPRQRVALLAVALLSLMAASVSVRAVAWAELP